MELVYVDFRHCYPRTCIDIMRMLLQEGRMDQEILFQEMRLGAGFTRSQIMKACKELNIVMELEKGNWYWRLPTRQERLLTRQKKCKHNYVCSICSLPLTNGRGFDKINHRSYWQDMTD